MSKIIPVQPGLKMVFNLIITGLLALKVTTAANLSGNISDNISNQPLSGITIWLENTAFSGTTDTNGDYLIENIPDGFYTIIVGGTNYKQKVYYNFGIGIYAGLNNERKQKLPSKFRLSQNYPNPFNPETTISYEIPDHSHVTLEVFDSLGRHVVTFFDGRQPPGIYSVSWNATNDQNQKIASGIYYLRIRAGQWQEILKMTLLE